MPLPPSASDPNRQSGLSLLLQALGLQGSPELDPSSAAPLVLQPLRVDQTQQQTSSTNPYSSIIPGQNSAGQVIGNKKQDRMPQAGGPPMPAPDYSPGRIPNIIPADRSLFEFMPEAPTIPETYAPGVAAPQVPQPGIPDQLAQTAAPAPQSVAPSQEDTRMADLFRALGAIQPPAAPEAPRVATPPPPARPNPEVGALLRLMMAGGGAPGGNPLLSQLLGRG